MIFFRVGTAEIIILLWKALAITRSSSFLFRRFRHQGFCLPTRTTSTRSWAGLAPLQPDDADNSVTQEDMKRWEDMYFEGEDKKKQKEDDLLSLISPNAVSCPIRVVSFDLDNTLWKTGPTIAGANDALAEYLESKDIVIPTRVEKVMGTLFKQSKSTYAPNDDAKAPTQLTKLRKDALRYAILEGESTQAPAEVIDNIDSVVEEAFRIWTKGRHNLIQTHLASNVVDTLEQIRNIDPNLKIGAITDGNSDPRSIPILEPYFDFVVNAERVGVSKPDPKLYLVAIREALESTPLLLQDLFGDRDLNLISDELLEDTMGPWWVHVGDDFVKDMVAAKALKMRCVWAKELVPLDKKNPPLSSGGGNDAEMDAKQKEHKKTLEEFTMEMSKHGVVVNMDLGGEDYLAQSMQEDYVDGICDRFDEIGSMVRTWHLEGLVSATNVDGTMLSTLRSAAIEDAPTSRSTSEQPQQSSGNLSAEQLETLLRDSRSRSQSNAATATATETTISIEEDAAPNGAAVHEPKASTKFCIACGAKLPAVAKFCSSCGEKQPEIL